MKKVKSLVKRLGKAYFNNWVELYRPAIDAGVPIIF